MATKGFLKHSALSLATFSVLTTGLQASALSDMNASLDLTTYQYVKVEFNGSVDTNGSHFLIENNTTNDDVNLTHDFNGTGNTLYFKVSGGTEHGTGNVLDATEAVKKIRGNTRNDLKLLYSTDGDFTNGVEANVSLLKTIADGNVDVNVSNDTWNLITIPAGLHTNAKEMIIANKATMIWGWDYSNSDYNWTAYPNRMEAGQGYWVRTRIPANTHGHLNDVMASDYNTTLVGDMNSSDINTSRFDQIIALFPTKDKWVLLGNSTDKNVIISDDANTSNDGNRSNGTYYFEDLLNTKDECYFVSIYHWKTTDSNTSGVWVNDTESGKTTEPIPAGAGMWVKQRLCNS